MWVRHDDVLVGDRDVRRPAPGVRRSLLSDDHPGPGADPPAKIDYGFAGGAGEEGSVQQKTATAEVTSPGALMPIGLSLNCLLAAAHNTAPVGDVLSGVVPLDYIAPDALTGSSTSTTGDTDTTTTTWPSAYVTAGSNLTVNTPSPSNVTAATSPSMTLTGSNWNSTAGLSVPAGVLTVALSGVTGGLPGRRSATTSSTTTSSGATCSRRACSSATYVTSGLPIVTPTDALSADLYNSSRFFWVALLSAPLSPVGGSAYPILTFRPVFLTQAQPSGLAALDLVIGPVGNVLTPLQTLLGTVVGLTPGATDHGLVTNTAKDSLMAMRFMTIEPTALPVLADDYTGPTSPYLGTGPKVIRLVQ